MNRIWLAIAFLQTVRGHGYMSEPPAQFRDPTKKLLYQTTTTAIIDPAFARYKWGGSPDKKVKMFATMFRKSKFFSLKAMFDASNITCGESRVDIAPVDVSAMKSMSWQNDQERQGFIRSHSGPCEAWLNDTMVARSDDCRSEYTTYPAVIPIDYSKCAGNCLFEFYWLALHEPQWQFYKNCVPVVNNTPAKKCKCC